MSTTRTPRAARKSAWEARSVDTRRRLTRVAPVAYWVAAPLLFLQFLAMLGLAVAPVATIMAYLDVAAPVAAAVLALVVVGGYAWVSPCVWKDAKDCKDKKARLYLVVTPVIALVPALFARGYAVEALDFVYDFVYGPTLRNESTNLLVLAVVLVLGLLVQAFVLWLLIQLPLGVVRRVSMAIRTADTRPSSEDTDTGSERRKKAKTPGSARFIPAFILAFLAWVLWLAFFDIGLI